MDFGLILVKYGLERILFRLSRSRHRDVFILKGALLFELWTEQRYRPTRFCAKNKSYVEKAEFKAVMEAIRNFLAPPVRTVQEGHSFTKTWKPGGPWR